MNHSPFIFTPGCWDGEGYLEFSFTPEKLKYFLQWEFAKKEENVVESVQQIEIEGGAERLVNKLHFFDPGLDTFSVTLENSVIHNAGGKGVIDPTIVAWEFRDMPTIIEGFEIYKLQEDGSYSMKAEYMSPDRMRTIISGRIWERSGKSE